MNHFFKLTHLALAATFIACQSTPVAVKDQKENANNNGTIRSETLQISTDARSSFFKDYATPSKTARDELAQKKDLSPLLLTSVAELSLLSGDIAKSEQQARAVLKKDLKNISALKVLIKAALAANKPDAAIILADSALAIQPRDSDILCLKGLAFYKSGDVLSARDTWKKAAETNPNNIIAHLNLGALYYHNRNIQRAGASFEKALVAQPDNIEALIGKAVILDAQGQFEPARTTLKTVISKYSKAALAYYNLALIENERFDNAEGALENTEKYLALNKPDRKNFEKLTILREELRAKVAKKGIKMSDEELRKMAATQRPATSESPVPAQPNPTPVKENSTEAKTKTPPQNSAPANSAPAKTVPTESPKPADAPENSEDLEKAIK